MSRIPLPDEIRWFEESKQKLADLKMILLSNQRLPKIYLGLLELNCDFMENTINKVMEKIK